MKVVAAKPKNNTPNIVDYHTLDASTEFGDRKQELLLNVFSPKNQKRHSIQ